MKNSSQRRFSVRLYQSARGEFPVRVFILRQNAHNRAHIDHMIAALSDGGPFLKPPYAKKITTHLYELRKPGKTAFRIFYTLHNGEYYLLHIFHKKSQKTPRKELKIALDRLREII